MAGVKSELYWLGGILVGFLAVAGVVNAFAVAARPRLRRPLTLLVLAAVAYVSELICRALGMRHWTEYADLAREGFLSFVVIQLIILLTFVVLLPRLRLAVPMIATELVAGAGYVVTLLGVLARHDIDLKGVLATGAVVSAVLAISMQQTLGNILGGIAVQLDGSIHEGNWIQFENGKQGRIRAIRWRHSIVETRDYQSIVVPNAWLLSNNVMILAMRDGVHAPQRCWAYFNVDYRYSPVRVCRVVDQALRSSPIANVSSQPGPVCLCLDFGKDGHESYTTYGVQYWIDDMGRNDSTGSRVRLRIFAALERAEIPLAIPAAKQMLELHDAAHDEKHVKRRADANLDAIKSIALLRSLNDEELRTLADGLRSAPFLEGEVMTRQGAIAHYLYIMTAGRAEIRTTIDPDGDGSAPAITRKVAELTAPDFFGEMGLMTGAPRTADVVALTDVECYRLDKATFERVLLARPEIAVELSEKLAARRVQLFDIHKDLDEAARQARVDSETARILGAIKTFFGLASNPVTSR